jgi:phage gp29-like protein
MELAPWTAPSGHSVDSYKLSLERPRPLPPRAPAGRVSRDLQFFDHSGLWHPEEGVTPERIRVAFRQAERGYPEMQVRLCRGLREGDAHARSLWEKRNAAVASKPTVFQPGEQTASAQNGARVFEIAMRRLDIRRTLGHLLECVHDGYSAAEIEWGTIRVDGSLWIVPVDLVLVQPERFRIGSVGMMGPDGASVRIDELRILADLKRPQGDDLDPGKWVFLRYGNGPLARAGQSRTAAPLLMGKRYGFRDWLILSQRYGIPMPIAKYKESVEEWAKEVCRMIIENLGSDGGAVVPEGVELEIVRGLEVDKALQGPLIEYCNRELSKLVNGSTDATDGSQGGSYARAAVHGEVRFESVRDDASALHTAIDLMIATPFAVWNGVSAPPLMRQQIARDFSPQSLVALADGMTNKLGVKVSKQQLFEETGLRPPLNDDDATPGAPTPTKDSPDLEPEQRDA